MKTQSTLGLFFDQLNDIYSMETQLVEALPQLLRLTDSPGLKERLLLHIEQTKGQRQMVAKIFGDIRVEIKDDTCKAMEVLIAGGYAHLKGVNEPKTRDLMMIAHCLRIEHFEIAAYTIAARLASGLNMAVEAATLLEILTRREANAKHLLALEPVIFGLAMPPKPDIGPTNQVRPDPNTIPSPDASLLHTPFRSFWMGGFECTDHLNIFGDRVDFLTITKHFEFIDEDYRRLERLNIRTVREGIRWSRIETSPFVYDWTMVALQIECAREHGIQLIWDICHFGFPDDLTPLHPMFARRFAAICRAFATFFRSVDAVSTFIVTPINEVGFLSWLGGDVRSTSPYCVGQGWEVKYRLMTAYIQGVKALKEVDPAVRILTTEPLVSITHAPDASQAHKEEALNHHEGQFQALDMLGGRLCPELRGRPEYLDLLGFNFYYNNQWVKPANETLDWKRSDPRWVPLHQLLQKAYVRYESPLVLSETSHPKEDRPLWLDMLAKECVATLEAGVPLLGVCWYPIIDRPDWDHLETWHQSGVWDRAPGDEDQYERVFHEPTGEAFLRTQSVVDEHLPKRLTE